MDLHFRSGASTMIQMTTSKQVAAVMAALLAITAPAPGAETKPSAKPAKAIPLFDGDELGDWSSVKEFNGSGDVHVSFEGYLTLEHGAPLTGIVWTGEEKELPRSNYEISLEAMKYLGDDFFCALTFPVGKSHATFIVGGWGGVVVGLSSIDGKDASNNETTLDTTFENDRWYKIRVRVTDDRLAGWLDDKKVFDVALEGKSIGLRPGPIKHCAPLGIANFLSRTAYRKIELRKIEN